jgi:uncharacterized repeat protein (TIGR01451 family)
VLPNQRIGQATTTLLFEWEAGSDGSGIAGYRAGWSTSAAPDPAALQSYAPNATRQAVIQLPAISGSETLYAHLSLRDIHGNEQIQTFGPIIRDSGPSIGLSKTGRLVQDADGNQRLTPGDTIEWTITARNSGSQPVHTWSISDTLDANTTLVAGSPAGTRGQITVTGATIALRDAALAPGEEVVLTVRATVNPRAQIPAGTVAIENQASFGATDYPSILSDDPATESIGDPTRLDLLIDTLPDTSISVRPPSLSLANAASFDFGGADDSTPDAQLAFECRLDGATFAPCASPQSYSGLPDGRHTFEVRALDAEHKADPTPAGYSWTVATSCATATPTISGTADDNLLIGTAGTDIIFGLGGNDIIDGAGGDDLICGGDGNDNLLGNNGDDIVEGGNGGDNIVGWAGNDRLLGGAGNDALFGWTGDDVLAGGSGLDSFSGGLGTDKAVDFNPDEGDTKDGTIE